MIEPLADAIAAPATKLFLAERHPELTQIPQLVEQQRARLLPAREHPSDLAMRQAQVQRGNHRIDVIPHLILCKGIPQAFAAVNPAAEHESMKFPVFSLLAGNLASETGSLETLPPPAGSPLRHRLLSPNPPLRRAACRRFEPWVVQYTGAEDRNS